MATPRIYKLTFLVQKLEERQRSEDWRLLQRLFDAQNISGENKWGIMSAYAREVREPKEHVTLNLHFGGPMQVEAFKNFLIENALWAPSGAVDVVQEFVQRIRLRYDPDEQKDVIDKAKTDKEARKIYVYKAQTSFTGVKPRAHQTLELKWQGPSLTPDQKNAVIDQFKKELPLRSGKEASVADSIDRQTNRVVGKFFRYSNNWQAFKKILQFQAQRREKRTMGFSMSWAAVDLTISGAQVGLTGVELPLNLVEGFLQVAQNHKTILGNAAEVNLQLAGRSVLTIDSVVDALKRSNVGPDKADQIRQLPFFIDQAIGLYMKYSVKYLNEPRPVEIFMVRAGMLADGVAKKRHTGFNEMHATLRDLNVLWQSDHPAVARCDLYHIQELPVKGTSDVDYGIFYSIPFERTLYTYLTENAKIHRPRSKSDTSTRNGIADTEINSGANDRDDIVRSAFAGLGYLHHHGVQHKCITPHSIAVSSDTDRRPRLVAQMFDFTQATSSGLVGRVVPEPEPEGERDPDAKPKTVPESETDPESENEPVLEPDTRPWFEKTGKYEQTLPDNFFKLLLDYETWLDYYANANDGDMKSLPVALFPLFLSNQDVSNLFDMFAFIVEVIWEASEKVVSSVEQCKKDHERAAFSFLEDPDKFYIWSLIVDLVYTRSVDLLDTKTEDKNGDTLWTTSIDDPPYIKRKNVIDFDENRLPGFFWLSEYHVGPANARRMQLLYAMCSALYGTTRQYHPDKDFPFNKFRPTEQIPLNMHHFNRLWMGYDYRGQPALRPARGIRTSILPQWRHRNDTLSKSFVDQTASFVTPENLAGINTLRDILVGPIFGLKKENLPKIGENYTSNRDIYNFLLKQKNVAIFPWPSHVQYQGDGFEFVDPDKAWDDLRNLDFDKFADVVEFPLALARFKGTTDDSKNLTVHGGFVFQGTSQKKNALRIEMGDERAIYDTLIISKKTPMPGVDPAFLSLLEEKGSGQQQQQLSTTDWFLKRQKHFPWRAEARARDLLRDFTSTGDLKVQLKRRKDIYLGQTEDVSLKDEDIKNVTRYLMPIEIDRIRDRQMSPGNRADWVPSRMLMPQATVELCPPNSNDLSDIDTENPDLYLDFAPNVDRQKITGAYSLGMRYICLDHMRKGSVTRIANNRGSSLSIEIVYIDDYDGTKNVYIYYPNADVNKNNDADISQPGTLRLESLHYEPTGELMSHILYMIEGVKSYTDDGDESWRAYGFLPPLHSVINYKWDSHSQDAMVWPDVKRLEDPRLTSVQQEENPLDEDNPGESQQEKPPVDVDMDAKEGNGEDEPMERID